MEVKLGHLLEDTVGLLSMGIGVRGGNEEIVHVDDELSFCDHVLEGVVHKSLEYGRGVTEAKEHDH